MTTERHVKEIFSIVLGVDESRIVPHAEIVNDLGADSLDKNELIMAFEDEFDLEIPDDASEKFKCVRDVIEYIDSKV